MLDRSIVLEAMIKWLYENQVRLLTKMSEIDKIADRVESMKDDLNKVSEDTDTGDADDSDRLRRLLSQTPRYVSTGQTEAWVACRHSLDRFHLIEYLRTKWVTSKKRSLCAVPSYQRSTGDIADIAIMRGGRGGHIQSDFIGRVERHNSCA